MGLVPVARKSVSDEVFAQLRDAIVGGVYVADDALPSERELAATFEVNRHAVREGLRRLQQIGLVRVSQGGATRVLDWRQHAGLDLAMALTADETPLPVTTLARDVLEMRATIGADAARLCALRADGRARAAIAAAVEAYANAVPDLALMGPANLALWRRIVEGCGNVAYLLAFNSLTSGTLAVGTVPPQHRTAELLDVAAHWRLSRLIDAGDADAAHLAARALLSTEMGARRS